MDEHTNLLITFVNYDRKKFYNIGPRLVEENTEYSRRHKVRARKWAWPQEGEEHGGARLRVLGRRRGPEPELEPELGQPQEVLEPDAEG